MATLMQMQVDLAVPGATACYQFDLRLGELELEEICPEEVWLDLLQLAQVSTGRRLENQRKKRRFGIYGSLPKPD